MHTNGGVAGGRSQLSVAFYGHTRVTTKVKVCMNKISSKTHAQKSEHGSDIMYYKLLVSQARIKCIYCIEPWSIE